MPWKFIIIGVALAAAAVVAVGLLRPFDNGSDRVLRLPGVVESQEVKLGSKIGGRVKRVAVTEGQLVEADQELVVFDVPELEAQALQAEGRLHAMEADLERAVNGPRPEEIRQAQSDLETAQADLRWSRQEFERVAQLFPGNISRADYDAARASFNRAQGRAGAAEAKLALLKAGTRKEDIAQARAQVAEARGRLNEIRANLREAVVRAPERAVVEVLAVRKGDLVPPNQPVVRILRAADLWVRVYVPETQLGKVRLGQGAEVTIDAYPGDRFPGTVIFIDPVSEFTPRNVQSVDERRHQVFGIKVQIQQPTEPGKQIFKSGMAAEVTLPLSEAR